MPGALNGIPYLGRPGGADLPLGAVQFAAAPPSSAWTRADVPLIGLAPTDRFPQLKPALFGVSVSETAALAMGNQDGVGVKITGMTCRLTWNSTQIYVAPALTASGVSPYTQAAWTVPSGKAIKSIMGYGGKAPGYLLVMFTDNTLWSISTPPNGSGITGNGVGFNNGSATDANGSIQHVCVWNELGQTWIGGGGNAQFWSSSLNTGAMSWTAFNGGTQGWSWAIRNPTSGVTFMQRTTFDSLRYSVDGKTWPTTAASMSGVGGTPVWDEARQRIWACDGTWLKWYDASGAVSATLAARGWNNELNLSAVGGGVYGSATPQLVFCNNGGIVLVGQTATYYRTPGGVWAPACDLGAGFATSSTYAHTVRDAETTDGYMVGFSDKYPTWQMIPGPSRKLYMPGSSFPALLTSNLGNPYMKVK